MQPELIGGCALGGCSGAIPELWRNALKISSFCFSSLTSVYRPRECCRLQFYPEFRETDNAPKRRRRCEARSARLPEFQEHACTNGRWHSF